MAQIILNVSPDVTIVMTSPDVAAFPLRLPSLLRLLGESLIAISVNDYITSHSSLID